MKAALRIVCVNLAVLAAGLLIVELVFGNWIFGPDYRALNIPRNTQRVFDVGNLYPGGLITYTRDAHGLRGPYANTGSIDILTLGGSTTNQLYVDDAKTWQAVMRRGFADAGRDVSVVNAAVDGQSTRGHIALFHRWFPLIKGLKARFVLVYAGINDVALEFAEQYDDMRSPEPVRRLKEQIKNKSALYDFYRTLKGMFVAHNAHLVHGADWTRPADWTRWQPSDSTFDPPDAFAGRLAAYEARLRKLNAEIAAFGARAIFVTQPSAEFRIRDGWIMLPIGARRRAAMNYFLELDAFNRTTLRVCVDIGAICVDLARDVAFDDGDFYDRVHNTDRGAAKIGDYLYGALKGVL